MTWPGPENAEPVRVPDVVGLEVGTARKVAWEAGVVLAPPDPDGPSLRELTWPGQWTVTAQRPAPGSIVHHRGSLVVEFRPGPPPAGAPGTPPPGGSGDGAGDR
ncbi:PASTA domain-containing protein, partial [Kitasatospora phosalacinea]|uniref:PASTA domain-containing protein n=1 Tax=Kitasatospora phosalacinea TaxID=2065 RepID=UPI00365D3C7A